MEDPKRNAPSSERNKEPIAAVLAAHAPFSSADAPGTCLEIASGTGQHVAHFAARFPHITFQPTEYSGGSASPESPAYLERGGMDPVFASINAWCEGLANVRQPTDLDAAAAEWPVEAERFDAILCANILHISPYCVSEGLIAGAARLLRPGGALFVYGPFMVDGKQTAPSNEAFDQRLKGMNAEWGVRCSTVLASLAASQGLKLVDRAEMPANNFVLVFRRESHDGSERPSL